MQSTTSATAVSSTLDVPATSPAGVRAGDAVSLAVLAREDSPALERRFAEARWSTPPTLEGHPMGRVLAAPGFDRGLVAKGYAAFAASVWMPWRGKSFAMQGAEGGHGCNRVRLFGLRFGAFRYRTYATASVVDGEQAFAIDYDVPDNPRLARRIYDEVRPVAPGLLLGRGMRRTRDGGVKLLLWFALDQHDQDGPISLRALSADTTHTG